MPRTNPFISLCLGSLDSNLVESLLSGFMTYVARQDLPWRVLVTHKETRLSTVENWDGMLIWKNEAMWVDHALHHHIPTVNIIGYHQTSWLGRTLVTVTWDESAIGRMAAEYLARSGRPQLALLGSPLINSNDRSQAFLSRARELHREPLVCHTASADESIDMYYYRLQGWLRNLPAGTGIFLHQDQSAIWLRNFCLQHGIRVPEGVAILGADNSQSAVDQNRPRISSVDPCYRLFGERAALEMHRMLSGQAVEEPEIYLPPLNVVERESTTSPLINDPLVTAALALLRKTVATPLSNQELAARLDTTQPTLWRHFHQVFRAAPKTLQLWLRLDEAERLLRTGHASVTAVAQATGFNHTRPFRAAFHKRFGRTPTDYRKACAG